MIFDSLLRGEEEYSLLLFCGEADGRNEVVTR